MKFRREEDTKKRIPARIFGTNISAGGGFDFRRFVLVASMFAIAGIVLLIRSFAAGPIMSLEGEGSASGRSGNLSAKSDQTASNNSYLQFGAVSGTESDIPVAPLSGKTWQKVFYDEFSGNTLDTSKWSPCYPWGCDTDINEELQAYMPSQVSVSDGSLHLTAEKCQNTSQCDGHSYKSGSVSSVKDYNTSASPNHYFTYGYFEARVDVPTGKGFWPAFWLLPPCSPAEIDIFEFLGHQTFVNLNYHKAASTKCSAYDGFQTGPYEYPPQGQRTGIDYRDGWNTFGVLWRSNQIIWYVNGVEATRFPKSGDGHSSSDVYKDRMAILLNLAVGGAWPGSPNAQTVFPQSFSIDYVRVYQEL